MTTTKKILILVLLIGSVAAIAQEEKQKKITKLSIRNVYVQTGIFSRANNQGTFEDFKKLAPQSLLLNNSDNFKGYSFSNGYYWNSRVMFATMVGIKFGDKEKKAYKPNPELRLGISYISGSGLTTGFYKETTKTFDTLTSSQGYPVYLDSVTNSRYNMAYTSDQIRFDASLLFNTDPAERWSLYAGVGFTAGVSLNANTEINYSSYTYLQSSDGSGSGYSSSSYNDDYVTEKYVNKANLGFSAFAPMGIDFRIGKKREFWNRTHLYYELRPSVNLVSIPELRTIANANLQNNFGIKISVN
jgi:hypothetical protein